MEVLNWPAFSPDLNQIDNICGALARYLYRNRRQNNTVEELKYSVLMNWTLLTHDMIMHDIESMPRRCRAVIKIYRDKIPHYEVLRFCYSLKFRLSNSFCYKKPLIYFAMYSDPPLRA